MPGAITGRYFIILKLGSNDLLTQLPQIRFEGLRREVLFQGMLAKKPFTRILNICFQEQITLP